MENIDLKTGVIDIRQSIRAYKDGDSIIKEPKIKHSLRKVHAKIISERLGHANIGMTMNIYGHVLRSADYEASNKFDSILSAIMAK
ncbi:hypothetical protein [Paenibacillus polymyxa]|uniref:hypothetical protein n=1 Tax=Paenibacillus polymyxa TaxID=1406 RepID=UPI000ECFF6F3|nr:hypothetical protein [Paenibacillus polymyxa]MEE4562804.1 hypothetical protein [Paenibacillus polymyxa]RGL29273.1 hypothetical protein DXC69_25050 [Paenibacillus polymyxa]UMR34564.1 hypothetical protein MJ749_18015 [Paenibacillus polymyxa]